MRRLFLTFTTVVILFSNLTYAMSLKEKLSTAEKGSYLVFEQNKNYTFFVINENTQKKVIIEEVTIPENRISEELASEISTCGFRNWFERGAPQHTSWTMALINSENGHFEEMYSFTQKGWIDVSKMDSFMTTLFNLQFEPLSDSERKHIGLPPGRNQIDKRPLWQPRLIVEGKWVPNVYFTAWKSRWPADGSELSQKIIELYIPEERKDSTIPSYPTFFPFLVEVEGKMVTVKVRVIDSGFHARSHSPPLPLRPPQLMSQPKLTSDGIVLFLKSPSYYEDFVILAENQDEPFTQTLPINFTIKREGENVFLLLNVQDLAPKKRYRFVIAPKEHPAYCLETEPVQISETVP